MLYQITSQWRMILTALILLALAALALVKGVSVLAKDGGLGGGQPRQTVQAPAAGANERGIAATSEEGAANASGAADVGGAADAGGAATPRPPAGTTHHTIKSGETLGKIALQYGVTTAALANANGITNPDLIRVGQKLVVPGR